MILLILSERWKISNFQMSDGEGFLFLSEKVTCYWVENSTTKLSGGRALVERQARLMPPWWMVSFFFLYFKIHSKKIHAFSSPSGHFNNINNAPKESCEFWLFLVCSTLYRCCFLTIDFRKETEFQFLSIFLSKNIYFSKNCTKILYDPSYWRNKYFWIKKWKELEFGFLPKIDS